MSNPYRDKLLGIGVISARSRSTTVREGRHHPETGVRWKATTEGSTTHIEHNTKDDRVDAVVRPSTIRAVRVRSTSNDE